MWQGGDLVAAKAMGQGPVGEEREKVGVYVGFYLERGWSGGWIRGPSFILKEVIIVTVYQVASMLFHLGWSGAPFRKEVGTCHVSSGCHSSR